jgi:hypothetical protein
MMRDVAPGFLRPNPNPSSQDVPGPWFRLLYIIHPHQSMIPCLSGRRHPSELQEPAGPRPRFSLVGLLPESPGTTTDPVLNSLYFHGAIRLLFVAFGILILYLYYLACTISSIDLMVTMMTTIMFCFLEKKMVNVMWLSAVCVTICLSVTARA